MNDTTIVGDVSIEAFGGGTAVADNTAALIACLCAHGTVQFGAGVYAFETSPEFTIPVRKTVSISGFGADVTILQFASGHGLCVNFTDNSNSVHIDGLTLATDGINTAAGLALTLLTGAPSAANSPFSTIENISFRGSDGYVLNDYWSVGVVVNGVSNINFINCVFTAGGVAADGYTGNGNAVLLQTTAANEYDCVFNFTSCNFNYVGGGILYGADTQGVTVAQCNFTGGSFGINAFGGEPGLTQLTVTGSQFNVRNVAINLLSAVPDTMIANNLFILPKNCMGIQLNPAWMFSIIGNTFNGPSAPKTGQNGIVINNVPAGQSGGVITGNVFYDLQTAILLQSGSTAVNVQTNSYCGNGSNVVNQGHGNSVGVATP